MAGASVRVEIVAITRADDPAVEAARELVIEYARALGVDLCFQGFDRELVRFPGDYLPPRGALLLARRGRRAVGCVAIRPLGTGCCEMKRLYVQPAQRGRGLGVRLVRALLDAARGAGYQCMRLDTLAQMHSARRLYAELGFVEIAPYYHNPIPGAVYLECALGGGRQAASDTG